MTLRTMVFTTARTGRLSHDDLMQLLVVERARNAQLGITGVLALHDKNVMGIVEGPEAAVRARVDEVASDPANVDVQILIDDPLAARTFPDWSMAFRTDDPAARALDGFVDLFAPDRGPDPAVATSRSHALLEWFLRTASERFATPRTVTPVRNRAIEATMQTLREVSPARCTPEFIARRGGMTTAELTAVFPTMPMLLAATLAQWLGQVTIPLMPVAERQGAIAYLRALVLAFADEPGLDRLIVTALANAADVTEPSGEAFLTSYRAFRTSLQSALEADVAAGRVAPSLDPVVGARQLLALFDGLRIQHLFDPEADLAASFDQAAEALRRGWVVGR